MALKRTNASVTRKRLANSATDWAKIRRSFSNCLRGISIAVRDIFKTYQLINPPNEHRVIVYLIADHRSGEPVASSDLSEVRFFNRDELRELSEQRLISPFVEKVLREAALL